MVVNELVMMVGWFVIVAAGIWVFGLACLLGIYIWDHVYSETKRAHEVWMFIRNHYKSFAQFKAHADRGEKMVWCTQCKCWKFEGEKNVGEEKKDT